MFPGMEDVVTEYGEYVINGPWNSDLRPMYRNLQDKDDERTESGIYRASCIRIKCTVYNIAYIPDSLSVTEYHY